MSKVKVEARETEQESNVFSSNQKTRQLYKRAQRLTDAGRNRQAEDLWRKLIDTEPGNTTFLNGLGLTLKKQGKAGEALKVYEASLKDKPSNEAFARTGEIFRLNNDLEAAINMLTKAIELDENNSEAWKQMALVYWAKKKYEHAVLLFNKAAALDNNISEYAHYLSILFRDFTPKSHSAHFEEAILNCLNEEKSADDFITSAWHRVIFYNAGIKNLIVRWSLAGTKKIQEKILEHDSRETVNSPLLIKGVENIRCCEPALEAFLTKYRNACLAIAARKEWTHADEIPGLLYSLARQCFFNEYVFYETEEENELLEKLIQDFADAEEEYIRGNVFSLLTLSCYRPLYSIQARDYILSSFRNSDDQKLKNILETQIREPLEELEIRKNIKTLGKIEDEVSVKVRSQYEENPYPRWSTALDKVPDGIELSETNRKFMTKAKSALIAGCGTGLQIYYLCKYYPQIKVTAVDLSLASLSYAMRKLRYLGLDRNIDFYQADILELGSLLNHKYDHIACTGVLHHMHDPFEAWKVLTDLLKPGGVMKIGLYSELARQEIVLAREFIAERGYGTSQEDIRHCRYEILRLPSDNPVSEIVNRRDFYSLSTCRDLIFHCQEQRYTIPRLKKELDELGLVFAGFTFPDRSHNDRYLEMFPDDPEKTNLDNWHIFEEKNPNTFKAMYQFWCVKKR
jgi:SAM-dependent methyltransferase/Flp pilus assembly protein TadD